MAESQLDEIDTTFAAESVPSTPPGALDSEPPSSFANGRCEVKTLLGEGGKKNVYFALRHRFCPRHDPCRQLEITYGNGDPPELELYKLETSPNKFTNVANMPGHAEKQVQVISQLLEAQGDPAEIQRQVMQSEVDREVIRATDGGKIF